jgi:carboxymethylenebutenolidase
VRSVADQLAGAGYIAIAPDLLSGQTYSGVDEARKAISQLSDPQVMADLDAVAAYVAKLPASNGKVTAVGFCWGGGTVFKFANHNRELKATYVFTAAARAIALARRVSKDRYTVFMQRTTRG